MIQQQNRLYVGNQFDVGLGIARNKSARIRKFVTVPIEHVSFRPDGAASYTKEREEKNPSAFVQIKWCIKWSWQGGGRADRQAGMGEEGGG